MRRYRLNVGKLVVSLALCGFLPGCFTLEAKSAKLRLRGLFRDAWEFHLEENPVFATTLGDRRGNDRLRGMSRDDIQRRADARREFLLRLDAIPRDQLTRNDQVNYDIFRRVNEDHLAEHAFHSHLIPITNRSGFHIEFPELPKKLSFVTVRDFDDYLARLRAFGRFTDEHIELLREGVRSGYVLPKVVLEGYEGSISAHITEAPETSALYAPFREIPQSISPADAERLRADARAAIAENVVPAYERFLEFWQREYFPSCRESIAASALPNGEKFYAHRVRRFTTLDVGPEEVHAVGLAEVTRLRREMAAIIAKVEFDGTFAEFLRFLRTDPRFYVETPEELFKETALVLKNMDGKLPLLFKTLPRMPYGIEPVPDYIAPKTTPAYYQLPSGDGTRPGIYFINTYKLDSRPLYEVEALSYHEAVPGHHLQLALQQELEDVPEFRRFSRFTAFIEGWALYSERLGLEVGFYRDPYSDFGRLTYEMWRACRLVVDTGMHALGWSRERAIEFMAENTALTLHTVETEIDRYIAWPGQALAYKMGELKITELRRRAERELGARFDVREFHDVVLLSGSVPLTLLEENVARYIEKSRSRE